jgi:hypothetical protein
VSDRSSFVALNAAHSWFVHVEELHFPSLSLVNANLPMTALGAIEKYI